MPRISKAVMNSLVSDTITYRLKSDEAVRYIEQVTGIKISVSLLRKKQHEINTDESMNTWLNIHTRIGFVRTHRQLLNEMNMVQQKLLREILLTDDRGEIIELSREIRETNRRISELNMGLPVIAQIRQRMESDGKTAAGIQASPTTS